MIDCGLSAQILTWAAVYSYVCPVDLAPYVLRWLWQGDQGLRGPAGNPGKEGPKVSHPKSEIREENHVIGRHMSLRYVHSLPFSCNSGSTFPLLQQGIAGQMYYKWCNNYNKKLFAYCTVECMNARHPVADENWGQRWALIMYENILREKLNQESVLSVSTIVNLSHCHIGSEGWERLSWSNGGQGWWGELSKLYDKAKLILLQSVDLPDVS